MLFRLSGAYLKQRWLEVCLVVVLQIGATSAALELPVLNARIIDEGVAVADIATIWRLGAWMVGLTFVQAVATAVAVFVGSRVAMGLGAWLRERIFVHVQRFSVHDVHHFGAPSLITRSTNDVQQIQTVIVMLFAIMVQAPIMGIGALVLAYRQDPNLSVLLWVMVPLLTVTVGVVMKFLAPQFAVQQQRIDAMNTVLREELSGQRVIRAFVRQDFMGQRYTAANMELRQVALRIGALFAVLFPLMVLIVSLTNAAVVWWGAHYVDAGQSQVGSLFAFLSYIGMLFGSVMMSAMMLMMVPRAEVAAGRVSEVVTHVPSVVSPVVPVEVPVDSRQRWTFALDGVDVRFPGAQRPVLSNVSVTFEPGTCTAIIGATGSGKTTLVSLLPRLLDVSAGRVTVNGVSVQDVDVASVRERVAMVPQTAYLFSGTVASTVAGVDDVTPQQRERVEWALEGACAAEFVARLDAGIDSEVVPGGMNFSGGQRQRLSIARALYRRADVYILDDSSSALDPVTDAQLRANLRHYTDGAAVIIVAQRVASVKDADSIVVLDAGQIVGRGTHEELLESCPTYREIVDSQSGEEGQ